MECRLLFFNNNQYIIYYYFLIKMWLVFFSGVKISATFFLFQVLPNTWYKYIFPTTSSSYTRTDLRIFEQTKVWKCDQISQLLLWRSYIEKVWNIVTHEGNTKLPFALEHIRTTMFGAWESTCEELCFEKGNTDHYVHM